MAVDGEYDHLHGACKIPCVIGVLFVQMIILRVDRTVFDERQQFFDSDEMSTNEEKMHLKSQFGLHSWYN